MEAGEALDRELLVERAEALRAWLGELPLSEDVAAALGRELGGIIANDPGSYINGHRPLAGLTLADLLAELAAPGGGAVGRVRGLGPEALVELRAMAAQSDTADSSPPAPAAPRQRSRPGRTAPVELAPEPQPEPTTAELTEPVPEAAEVASPAPRRRGRPRRDAAAAAGPVAPEPGPQPEPTTAELAEPVSEAAEFANPVTAEPAEPGAETTEVAAPAPRRRGRPRRDAAPVTAGPAVPALKPEAAQIADRSSLELAAERAASGPALVADLPAASSASPTGEALRQLERLWPALHPQARRAVLLYASTLLTEGLHEA